MMDSGACIRTTWPPTWTALVVTFVHVAPPAGTPTACLVAQLERLTFTAQMLQQELRLYPSLHTIVRHAVDGVALLGWEVSPGHTVAFSASAIHRSPEVWPDPERFAPERFDPAAARDRIRLAHLPFGAGRRSCSGVHLALRS